MRTPDMIRARVRACSWDGQRGASTPVRLRPSPILTALIVVLPAAAAAVAQTRPANRSRVGVNIGGLSDYSSAFMFIDVMRTSRRFGSVERPWEGEVPLDADGWPTADAGVIAFSEQADVNGAYRLSFTGRATVSVVRSPAELRNVAYDAATNRTSGEVVVNAPAGAPARLFLSFTETAGGVRDIRLLRPGYADDAQVFTDEYLRALEPFGCLRFMDFLRTNDSPLVTWADRAEPADAQLTIKGGPYEYAIDLGNRLGKDVWLTVPAGADEPFVRSLAELVKVRLGPGVNCYVEWSNELWNSQFKQHGANLDAARAEVARGDRTLSLGGRDSNARHWGWRRVARRTVEIGRIFRDVLGKNDARLRMVLAGQHANPAVLETGLRYIQDNFGPPREHLYGIAIAPYFGSDDKELLKRADLTVDQVCDVLLRTADESRDADALAHHALAKRYGLKSLAYEGGIDLRQYDASVDAKTRAQFDPRAGQAVERHLRGWFDGGGDAYVYYTLVGRYTKYGYWGLTNDTRRLDVPKYDAAARVAREH